MKFAWAVLGTLLLGVAGGYVLAGGGDTPEQGDRPTGAELAAASAEPDADGCTQPVLMVVRGTITDPARMREYAQALQAAELYPATSGYYLHVGPPVDVFEGEYPDNAFTVIARFPCLAHAQAFWYSDTYRELVEFRKHAAEVLVTVYRELDPPDFMEGRLEGGRFIDVPPVDELR